MYSLRSYYMPGSKYGECNIEKQVKMSGLLEYVQWKWVCTMGKKDRESMERGSESARGGAVDGGQLIINRLG